jgi:PAS domain S-box-containing protein
MIEALKSAADGAFVVEDDLRIHIWNEAAEEILGFGNSEVVGQLCYEILQGYDEEKRLICKACCRVSQLALKDEPVSNYDINALTNEGDRRWLNMSVLTYKVGDNEAKKVIVHFFRDISQKKDDELFLRRILKTARRFHNIPADLDDKSNPKPLIEKLTKREREVLTLLAQGLNTHEIAEALSISQNTTRNHVQHILEKFQVHSRMEAVVFALKNGLLD